MTLHNIEITNSPYMNGEMIKLIQGLDTYHIPYEVCHLWDGWQVNYPDRENVICDAICHRYSYGHEDGLLEIMGLVDCESDSVEGYLTAAEVLGRIHSHYFGTV